jgi:hypothetical protein
LFIVQDCDLVPDQRCSRDGDLKDQFTRTNVLLTIVTELVFDDFAHASEGGDILCQSVAQTVCFPQKLIVLLGILPTTLQNRRSRRVLMNGEIPVAAKCRSVSAKPSSSAL